MVTAPRRKPQEFGFKAGDSHLVVNAVSKTIKAFGFKGDLLWQVPCLADGQHPNWKGNQGDTPPGLYRIATIYNDFGLFGLKPDFSRELRSFGWVSFDLVDLEGNEDNNSRAGIMIHGGGTACGWDGAWQPIQPLFPTFGCIRMHNTHLRDLVLPLTRKGTVFVSVYQDNI